MSRNQPRVDLNGLKKYVWTRVLCSLLSKNAKQSFTANLAETYVKAQISDQHIGLVIVSSVALACYM